MTLLHKQLLHISVLDMLCAELEAKKTELNALKQPMSDETVRAYPSIALINSMKVGRLMIEIRVLNRVVRFFKFRLNQIHEEQRAYVEKSYKQETV